MIRLRNFKEIEEFLKGEHIRIVKTKLIELPIDTIFIGVKKMYFNCKLFSRWVEKGKRYLLNYINDRGVLVSRLYYRYVRRDDLRLIRAQYTFHFCSTDFFVPTIANIELFQVSI